MKNIKIMINTDPMKKTGMHPGAGVGNALVLVSYKTVHQFMMISI